MIPWKTLRWIYEKWISFCQLFFSPFVSLRIARKTIFNLHRFLKETFSCFFIHPPHHFIFNLQGTLKKKCTKPPPPFSLWMSRCLCERVLSWHFYVSMFFFCLLLLRFAVSFSVSSLISHSFLWFISFPLTHISWICSFNLRAPHSQKTIKF